MIVLELAAFILNGQFLRGSRTGIGQDVIGDGECARASSLSRELAAEETIREHMTLH